MEKKKITLLLSLLAIGIIILVSLSAVSLFTAAGVMKEEALPENADRADIMTVETADSEPIYFLREIDGLIGIFSEDNVMLERLDVAVMTLPAKDREMISKGITVKGTKNLEALKQDFTG